MLIYVAFMAAIAWFLHKESTKLLKNESELLREFCDAPVTKKAVLSLLRKVLLSALGSALLMLICFILKMATGAMLKPLAALSILCYTIGFMYAMLKAKNIH